MLKKENLKENSKKESTSKMSENETMDPAEINTDELQQFKSSVNKWCELDNKIKHYEQVVKAHKKIKDEFDKIDINKDDIIINKSDISLIIDPISLQYLHGGKIDYLENLEGSKFIVSNPNAKNTCGCGSSFSI